MGKKKTKPHSKLRLTEICVTSSIHDLPREPQKGNKHEKPCYLREVINWEAIIPGITLKLENKSGNQKYLQGITH